MYVRVIINGNNICEDVDVVVGRLDGAKDIEANNMTIEEGEKLLNHGRRVPKS